MLKYTIMFAVIAGLVLALAPAAQAVNYTKADYRWALGDVGGNWANAANWNVNLWDADLLGGAGDWIGFAAAANYPGEVAPLAEQFALDPQYPSAANPIIVNSVIPFRVADSITESGYIGGHMANGWNTGSTTTDGAIKVVTGGDIDFLTEHSNSQLGGLGNFDDQARTTIVIIEDGRLRMDNSRTNGGKWRIEMTGGIIDNSEGTGVSFWTATGAGSHDSIMNIHGGILEAENLPRGGAIVASANRLIDIQNDGVLKLYGNQLDDIQSYVDNGANFEPWKSGHIRGSNGVANPTLEGLINAGTGTVLSDPNSGELRWGYDSNNDMTYAWAVPEPATMALLAFGGLGLLIRRRRRA